MINFNKLKKFTETKVPLYVPRFQTVVTTKLHYIPDIFFILQRHDPQGTKKILRKHI